MMTDECEDIEDVYLELGNMPKCSDDGHQIFKGGFNRFNFNENVSVVSHPNASFAQRITNYRVISQNIGNEDENTFRTVLQPVSESTDKLNNKVMKKDFFVSLDLPLNDESGKNTFRDFLLKNKIVFKVDICEKEKILVKVVNTFSYMADWKGLLLCYQNLSTLFSPFSTRTKENRKNEDIDNEK